MSNLIQLNQMPQSKSEIAAYVSNVKDMILSGNIDGIDAAIMLKSLDEIIKSLRDDKEIKSFIQSEVAKYGKSAEVKGCKVSLSERKTYDFKDDSEWFILETNIQELKEKQKERETFLKAITKPVADSETGEMIYPAPYSSTDVVTVTLKR